MTGNVQKSHRYLQDRLARVVNKFHLIADNFSEALLTVRIPADNVGILVQQQVQAYIDTAPVADLQLSLGSSNSFRISSAL